MWIGSSLANKGVGGFAGADRAGCAAAVRIIARTRRAPIAATPASYGKVGG